MSVPALRQLVVMRHAQAGGDGGDMGRPLTHQGQADAAERGRQLAQWDGGISLALVSPARRTRQTAELALPAGTEVLVVEDIYEATPGQLLRVLEQAKADRLVLVGHNPGVAGLVSHLTRQTIAMASGAMVIIEFDPPAEFPLQAGSGHVVMNW